MDVMDSMDATERLLEKLHRIDLALLKRQKEHLVTWLGDQPDHECWGVVHLLDAIQDGLEGDQEVPK